MRPITEVELGGSGGSATSPTAGEVWPRPAGECDCAVSRTHVLRRPAVRDSAPAWCRLARPAPVPPCVCLWDVVFFFFLVGTPPPQAELTRLP